MNTRPGQVARALRAFRKSPDTRALKRELRDGNPYAAALIEARGCEYANGAIQRKAT